MMPVSGVSVGAVQPLTTAGKVPGTSRVQKPEEESRSRRMEPVMDKYVPEEPQEPSGRYWTGKDEGGRPKIHFNDPERAADAPKQPEGALDAKKLLADVPEEPDQAGQGAKGPERKKDKDEVWESNTDKVDQEIKKLKKKQQELEQRLGTETDEVKIKDLERQLSQVEQELKQKDSDTYRKQNASFTQLS